MTTPAAVKRSRRQRPTGALSQHQWGRVVHHCARLTTLWRRAAAEVVATQGDAEEEDDERSRKDHVSSIHLNSCFSRGLVCPGRRPVAT